jgi:hypothetical protein
MDEHRCSGSRTPFLPSVLALLACLWLLGSPGLAAAQQDEVLLFAVVTKVPKDKARVSAQVVVGASGGTVTEAILIPSESVQDNLIWRKLEVCHSLRAEGFKNQEGYRIVSVKVLDAGMLPMGLQGIAGDCLLKKALEFGPLVD